MKLHLSILRNLFATKLNTIQARAELKDYVDIAALLKYGLTLEDGLACARAIYGQAFDPGTSIRALCSYREGDLPQLPKEIQKQLTKAALAIDKIPIVKSLAANLAPYS